MWSFFSSDPTKSFPFDIGEKIDSLNDVSIWSLHEGKRKSNGEAVSVFTFDIKSSSESQVQLAKASFKKIKTLRHPNILTYIDGLENDKVIYFVTEAVQALEQYLSEQQDNTKICELAISWGLHQTAKGLSFLVNDCNFIHNNICLSSVFVNKAGEWKLGGLDYMYPAQGPDSIPPVKILPELEKYDPPERAGPGRRPTEKWSTDSWGLGCLIWEIFNGRLPRPNNLKSLGKIPKILVPNYCELVGANPKSRPNPGEFVAKSSSKGGFMDNQFVQTMLFLAEIQIKDATEKNNFFNGLPSVLDTFPGSFCKHRILPQLLHAFEYGNAGSAVLAPLFKLGKLLEHEEYQQKIVPCIVKLFSSTDRATRVKLLQQLDLFAEHLNPSIVNDKIYPNLVHGFSDTNPVVRESTIKSMLHLAPKLNYKNLNEELLKHFARLQARDDQGGIRTNTTVCLGKIAGHLNPQVRQKVLSSAYIRALKDPFPPARQAGVLAIAATNNFFTLQESAQRLLPALCGMTMDPEKSVRDQVFRAIKCFIEKLEKYSESPELQEDLEKDVKSGTSSSGAAGWAGWAVGGVSSLTSKFYKGGKGPTQKPQQATQPSQPSSEPTAAPVAQNTPDVEESKPVSPALDKRSAEPEVEEKVDDSWGDGWDDTADDWGDIQEPKSEPVGQSETAGGGWEDDSEDWGRLEDTTTSNKRSSGASGAMRLGATGGGGGRGGWGETEFTTDSSLPSTASYNWDQPDVNQDEFFNAMIADTGKKKNPVRKSPFASAASKPTNAASANTSSSSSLSQKATAHNKNSQRNPASMSQTENKENSDFDNWGGDTGWGEDSGWGTSSTKSSQKQKHSENSQADSGWGEDSGWGADDWADTGMSKAEDAKRLREQKKQERQRQLEEKRAAKQGAMKLGTKKLTKD